MVRADLVEQWDLLIEGQASREQVHGWADPRPRAGETPDPLVMVGLQLLFGATGAASEASPSELSRLRDAWLADCAAYDADPAGWRRARAQATLRGLRRDHPDRAPEAALVFLREGILTEQDVREAVAGDVPDAGLA
ncbi:MAG TPA: hypothetical protein VGM80_04930 [Gaiellaceae bacterium]